jgi:hypothetical protein
MPSGQYVALHAREKERQISRFLDASCLHLAQIYCYPLQVRFSSRYLSSAKKPATKGRWSDAMPQFGELSTYVSSLNHSRSMPRLSRM